MKWRLNAALALMVMAPVVLLAWLGLRSVRLEQERLEARLVAAAQQRLEDVDQQLAARMDRIKEEVLAGLSALPGLEADGLRRHARQARFVRQVFWLDAAGALQYPLPQAPGLTAAEQGFLQRTDSIWSAGEALFVAAEGRLAGARSGWYTWFLEDGINFLVWQLAAAGDLRGAEVDRYALLADVIGTLPSTAPIDGKRARSVLEERMVVRDPQGNVLYQWGHYVPAPAAKPLADLSLTPPLGAWQLAIYSPPLRPEGLAPAAWGLLLLILATAIVSALAASYILREHRRAVREAQQRVSFVNQVSHELKTPLTNIRMYAELLEQRAAGKDKKMAHYAGIVTAESRRLGRMIHNVLSFGRQQRGQLRLRRVPGILDDTVREVLEHFAAAFERRGITVHVAGGCETVMSFDRDVVEQILGNLLSNVEKYAGEGAVVELTTRCEAAWAVVTFRDNGPGVPAARREDIFQPFVRLEHCLTQTASGTGIGLSIARDLARLHGGDLILEPGTAGAKFRVTLKVVEDTV